MKSKLLYLLLFFSFIGWSQTIIFSENMGTPSGDTPIASNIFQNTAPILFSGTAQVRITDSSDQIGASGAGNVFFTPSNPRCFEISGIDTSNFTNLILSLGHYKNQNAFSNELIIEVSSDGINYTSLTYTRPTGTGTTGWILLRPSGTIPTTSNLRIRFRFTPTGSEYFRIDDIVLTGTPICGTIATTWNGTNWSNGTPTSTVHAIINSNYDTATFGNITACRLTVNTPFTVNVASGNSLIIQNEVKVNGSLTFKNNASLVQVNDNPVTPNTGNINYKRQTTQITNFDYTYWSSPVEGQTLYNLSPGTLYDKFFSFNAAANFWTPENSSNTMTVGQGYIIRGPQTYQAPAVPSLYEGPFMGVPNNGVVTVPLGGEDKSNLIGNPYPSAIDADAFINANSSVIYGTLYFWTHKSAIAASGSVNNPGSGQYAYTADDYASYNLTGGTATAIGGTAATTGGAAPTREIAAGQGFIAFSMTTGSATFNNSMRMIGGTTIDNSKFFRPATGSKSTKKTSVQSENRLWLNVTNEQGAFKQILIGYLTGATNGYDASYDGWNYNANPYINFYSINDDQNFSIQGRAIETQFDDSVPLGYSSSIKGDFQIAIDNVDGNLAEKDIYLTHKKNTIMHNLNSGPYTFSTDAGTFDDRFQLSYQAKTTLGVTVHDIEENNVIISQKENIITIHSNTEQINEVHLYDLTGREVLSSTKVNNKELQVTVTPKKTQVLLIKVKLKSGKLVTKKVLVN
ncbi:T9SS sorting signal type C domain-containing protein [Flavobacterium sp. 7A]|uniref:T9SS sorting signal type C domain-containing protein n=1 Tax=Flavobacterium sp. 7A TaxID=2940571 RepID=UPI0022265846|nr:T9SS sorting signal type C domain-containing protein [Flavobacterium sp. 7A]MCW2121119.1 hypothetical protein [Flavobacterium sp. 7A]